MPNRDLKFEEALRDRYVLERELGRGGMATVYLARDVKHDRLVALKVLHPELAASLGPERFLREIKLAARLQHPHILSVHDSGEADGQLWFTMPYVEGESLRERLKREGQLPVDDAVQITREAAQALDYAHQHGVIHRDIKPENILLAPDGNVLVADFGIARALAGSGAEERLTETGMSLGTPAYMSPEQAAGERTMDARSDVYSLACVLYEMLAGEPPFTGPTAQAIIVKRFSTVATPVRIVRPDVPEQIEQAITTALARTPAGRFAGTGEFARALKEPGISKPSHDTRRVARIAAVVIAIVLLTAVAWTIIEARRDSRLATRNSPSVTRLAVLPFLNLSGDAESDYFSNGVTEDITSELGRISGLKVIAHTSALQYNGRADSPRAIGQALGAAKLLQGSVRRVGDRVRVTARLIDAPTGEQVWSDDYNRDLRDVLAIQLDIAERIAESLRGTLSPQDRTPLTRQIVVDPDAYNLYLLGRYHFGKLTFSGWRRSIEYFEQAIARDSNFALAHVALADARVWIGYFGLARSREIFPAARTEALKALALDSALGDAHASLGLIRAAYEWDWSGAERSFKRAQALSPSSVNAHMWYALFVLSPQGRHEEAIEEMRRARELDPVSLQVRYHLGLAYYFARRYDAAINEYRQALDLDPNFSPARDGLGFAYAALGRFEEAIPEMRRAVADSTVTSDAVLGYVYAVGGRKAEARAILQRLQARARSQYVIPMDFSLLYTGLGDRDQAFRWLRRAYEERLPLLISFWSAPTYDALRGDPRYAALARDLGLGEGSGRASADSQIIPPSPRPNPSPQHFVPQSKSVPQPAPALARDRWQP